MIIIAFLAGLIIGSIATLSFILFRYRLRPIARRVKILHLGMGFGTPDLFNEWFVEPPEGEDPSTTLSFQQPIIRYVATPSNLTYRPIYNQDGGTIALSVESQAKLNEAILKHYNNQV